MQAAKVLDVTRSFVPVDPNAYPENLHATGDEDSPESRVPVVPYMGQNFLPTAHGYKSFFGVTSALGIASLAPNKPDYVFVYQNLAYKNIIIALCDTGIWMKAADSAGAWTQVVAKVAPADATFYEWYYAVIKNDMYVFRANDTAFYKIATDITNVALGVAVTPMVPSFITITAQLGMFRLGSRLGFWDAQNAVCWSNPDDFTDYTPSVLTGANVTTFVSVQGKISAIRAQGTNAIIYASKSIVGLSIQAGETFLAKAIPILQKSGVPYARQSVESAPNSTHFAYTTTGIYKIENGQAEVIVPEVFDFFKTYTTQPIYLRLLQGRYLNFEILDEKLITGIPQFSTGVVAPASLTFPGSTSLDFMHDNPSAADLCTIMNMVNGGMTDEQQAAASADLGGPAPKGTIRQPIYTCHIANNGVKDPDNITWGSVPCGFAGPNGTQFTMSPNIDNKAGPFANDSTAKSNSFGPDAWTDGLWTMERFVQYQTAIWKAEEKVYQKVIDKILNRAFTETKTTTKATGCVVSNPGPAYCTLGEYISKFSDYKFGFSKCSFWLTRYLLETKVIRAKNTATTACNPVITPLAVIGWVRIQNANYLYGTLYPTADAAAASYDYTTAGKPYSLGSPVPNANYVVSNSPITVGGVAGCLVGQAMYWIKGSNGGDLTGSPGSGQVAPVWEGPGSYALNQVAGSIVGGVVTMPQLSIATTTKVETSTALNELQATNTGVLGVESAWCELTHWKVTDSNGNVSYVPASSCTDYTDKTPGKTTGGTSPHTAPNDDRAELTDSAGNVCGIPYQSPDLAAPVNWPDQTITYPGSTFLLQNGGIAPKYPTIYGFFCYDLHLKKWGKAKFNYKQLLDYSPINSESSSPVAFANFGILAGAIKEDGFIYIFDDKPTDSWITWGKIGYYRQGMTDIQEVRFDFTKACTGSVIIDHSIDGSQVALPLSDEFPYSAANQIVVYPKYSAKWFNVTVKGSFDISYADLKMLKKGRR